MQDHFQSRRAQFCLKNGIPVVQPEYLFNLKTSINFIDPNTYKIPPLYGCVFSGSCFDDKSSNILRERISQYGGIFSSVLTSKSTHLIIPEGCNSIRSSIAANIGIPFVGLEQLDESINNSSILEPIIPPIVITTLFAPYSFRIPERANNSIRLLILQNKGQIASENDMANFAIECSAHHGEPVRNTAWLERCIERGDVFHIPPNSIFSFVLPNKPNLVGQSFFLCGFNGTIFLIILLYYDLLV